MDTEYKLKIFKCLVNAYKEFINDGYLIFKSYPEGCDICHYARLSGLFTQDLQKPQKTFYWKQRNSVRDAMFLMKESNFKKVLKLHILW